jgi:hypothetical protein
VIEVPDLSVETENIQRVMDRKRGTNGVILQTDVHREKMGIIGRIQMTENTNPDLKNEGISGKASLVINIGNHKVGTGINKGMIGIKRHRLVEEVNKKTQIA